jgi:hypothetical protein
MAGNQDLNPKRETYDGVMVMLKWGTVAAAIVAAFVVFLIAN